MSTSIGFKHGRALRRLVTEFAEGAQYLALGTKHLGLEGAASTRRYVLEFARGLAAKYAPIDMERAAEMAAFTIVTEKPRGQAS